MTAPTLEDLKAKAFACEIEPTSEPVGRQEPTLQYLPPVADEITAIAALLWLKVIGYHLAPWQLVAVYYHLVRGIEGNWAAPTSCMIVPRQNGKNIVIEAVELVHLFFLGSRQILHTAHKFKTAKSAFRSLRDAIYMRPELAAQVKSCTESTENTAIVLVSGARIDYIARRQGAGRGFTGELVVLDEAYAIEPETVSDLKAVVSSTRGQLIYASSTGFQDSEVLMALHMRALETTEEGARFFFQEWSADINEVDWDSEEAATLSNPSLGYFQSWEYIRDSELPDLDKESYLRERLGVWPESQVDIVIGSEIWSKCKAENNITRGNPPVSQAVSLEIPLDRKCAYVALVAELKDGTHLGDVATLNLKDVGPYITALMKSRRINAGITVDRAGGAAATAQALEAEGFAVRYAGPGELTRGTQILYDDVMSVDKEGWHDPRFLYVRDNIDLDSAAYTATRRLVGTTGAWTWKPTSVDVEPLRALSLALDALDSVKVNSKKDKKKKKTTGMVFSY